MSAVISLFVFCPDPLSSQESFIFSSFYLCTKIFDSMCPVPESPNSEEWF